MNLLIADDEMLIRRGLQSLNWASIGIDEVYTVQNGVEAQQLLLSTPIDLLICDIKMPGFTGLELAAMVKEHSMDTAVVLLTGFPDFDYARSALRSDVYEYLLKPLRPAEILATMESVRRQLEQKRYQAHLVRTYESTAGSCDTVSQMKNLFAKASPSTMEILTDIAEHFDQPLSLSDMAEQHHFSANYISKLVKKETGYSFTDILTAARLMNAAHQLADGGRVNQVSQRVGFSDQRYFSQVFRRSFGCSPTEYRDRYTEFPSMTIAALLSKTKTQGAE